MSQGEEERSSELIYIQDEEGKEEEFEILMTFELEENHQKYMMVVPTDAEDDEVDEVYAFRYDEEGDDLNLYLIEDDEEWSMVEETFNTMLEELD